MKNKVGAHLIILILLLMLFINSCKKDRQAPSTLETGTVMIDGVNYKTVKIGSQWWMSENLRATRYSDGTLIPKVNTDTTTWNNDTIGAYCFYNDNSENIQKCGLLYNWHAVSNLHKIAPEGWRIPSDADWKELEKYLGMSQTEIDKVNFRGTHEGEKLKKEGPGNWKQYDNVWATNESGFSAVAGNCRMFNGEWGDPSGLQSTGFWWSSTLDLGNNEAWYRHLDYKKTNVFREHGNKQYGFSIRCVKDPE